MNQPWKTNRWFASPWNFSPEVQKELHFPERIRIHDVTLRDGEQQTGIVFRRAREGGDRKNAGRGGRPPY